ncbi:hypothetical protein [Photobacterium satsumensis]|uniref:hypothetical protein n=1 Tax=Photobacterium satsumensis TaxID=2910239 RepID=UPI003D114916
MKPIRPNLTNYDVARLFERHLAEIEKRMWRRMIMMAVLVVSLFSGVNYLIYTDLKQLSTDAVRYSIETKHHLLLLEHVISEEGDNTTMSG